MWGSAARFGGSGGGGYAEDLWGAGEVNELGMVGGEGR